MIFDDNESGQTAVLIAPRGGRFGVEAADTVESAVVCDQVFSNDQIVTSASDVPDVFQVDVPSEWLRP